MLDRLASKISHEFTLRLYRRVRDDKSLICYHSERHGEDLSRRSQPTQPNHCSFSRRFSVVTPFVLRGFKPDSESSFVQAAKKLTNDKPANRIGES